MSHQWFLYYNKAKVSPWPEADFKNRAGRSSVAERLCTLTQGDVVVGYRDHIAQSVEQKERHKVRNSMKEQDSEELSHPSSLRPCQVYQEK